MAADARRIGIRIEDDVAVMRAIRRAIDGKGVRATVATGHSAAAYVVLLFVLDGFPYAASVAPSNVSGTTYRYVWPNGADLCPDVLIWGGLPPE